MGFNPSKAGYEHRRRHTSRNRENQFQSLKGRLRTTTLALDRPDHVIVSIPQRQATNSQSSHASTTSPPSFNPSKAGYELHRDTISTLRAAVSIPQRQATNAYHRLDGRVPPGVSIPQRQATNTNPPDDRPDPQNRFNPSKAGYERKNTPHKLRNTNSFQSLKGRLRTLPLLQLGDGRAGFNPSKAGYERWSGITNPLVAGMVSIPQRQATNQPL